MIDDAEATDRMIEAVLRSSSAGVDLDVAGHAIQEALEALLKQVQALNAVDYKRHRARAKCETCGKHTMHAVEAPRPDEVARAASHTAKVADDIVRMAQFAKGQPDSRPDLGGDWLRALDDEQIRTVQSWIAAKGVKS